MQCRGCETRFPFQSTAEYCQPCLDVCWTLVAMADAQQQEQEMVVVIDDRPQAPSTTATGLSIEKMLMRIYNHPRCQELDHGVIQELRRVGRFDHRRCKRDNDYIRGVWAQLHQTSVYS